MMPHKQHIIIVGAGIIGLSTAYALLSHGMRRVTVLEQEAVDHQTSRFSWFLTTIALRIRPGLVLFQDGASELTALEKPAADSRKNAIYTNWTADAGYRK